MTSWPATRSSTTRVDGHSMATGGTNGSRYPVRPGARSGGTGSRSSRPSSSATLAVSTSASAGASTTTHPASSASRVGRPTATGGRPSTPGAADRSRSGPGSWESSCTTSSASRWLWTSMLDRTGSPEREHGGRASPSIAGGRSSHAPASVGHPNDVERRSARAALAADLLVELDPVPLLGRLAALLADLPEEVVAVALLGGLATLATGLGPAHLRGVRHPTTSSPIRLPWLF